MQIIPENIYKERLKEANEPILPFDQETIAIVKDMDKHITRKYSHIFSKINNGALEPDAIVEALSQVIEGLVSSLEEEQASQEFLKNLDYEDLEKEELYYYDLASCKEIDFYYIIDKSKVLKTVQENFPEDEDVANKVLLHLYNEGFFDTFLVAKLKRFGISNPEKYESTMYTYEAHREIYVGSSHIYSTYLYPDQIEGIYVEVGDEELTFEEWINILLYLDETEGLAEKVFKPCQGDLKDWKQNRELHEIIEEYNMAYCYIPLTDEVMEALDTILIDELRGTPWEFLEAEGDIEI